MRRLFLLLRHSPFLSLSRFQGVARSLYTEEIYIDLARPILVRGCADDVRTEEIAEPKLMRTHLTEYAHPADIGRIGIVLCTERANVQPPDFATLGSIQ
uniref:Putative secreted protein n=1 Tax=Anopheles triannulatus TaxID=58253 RepID=A0A2M4B6C9_9DIPT